MACWYKILKLVKLKYLYTIAFLLGLASLLACNNLAGKVEYAYVAAPQAALRDHVAAVYNKTGVVHNGERVQVLERMQNKRFVRIRSPRGEEGWLQERYLASQQTYEAFQRMAQEFQNAPAQATALTRNQANLHVVPGRKTEHLYQLNENEKLELLQRTTADRNASPVKKNQAEAADAESGEEDQSGSSEKVPPVIMEDWWLVRDSQKRVGWLLGRMLYVDIPVDVAQYAEGQRIVAFYVLDEVQDQGKKIPEYLLLLSENKDGMPYDYDQIRVFTWNLQRHRYETAYREHDLFGVLPVSLDKEDFAQEGTLRTFTLHLKGETGEVRELKFKFNSPMVKRVLAQGEQSPKPHSPAQKHPNSI